MKVLHVVSSLNMGGAEQFVVDIASAMNQQSAVQADILSFGSPNDTLCVPCQQQGISVHHISQAGRLQQLVQLRRLSKGYDAVHIHSSHCLSSILLATLFQPGIRLYYTRHNTVIHRSWKWRLIYRLASRQLSQIVFIADIARHDFLKAYSSFQHKSTLIYNGIQSVAVNPNERSAGAKIRLGQVGRFVPLKAQQLLILALAQLSAKERQSFELHFFGDGPLQADCRQKAQSLLQDMSVIFHGLEMNKSRIYQAIDVLVVTSETEGLSLVMLEALSAGCLVIATNVGGNAEIVAHEHTGLLFTYPDVKQLSLILQRLLVEQEWPRWAENGHKHYCATFTQQQCVQRYLDLYSENTNSDKIASSEGVGL